MRAICVTSRVWVRRLRKWSLGGSSGRRAKTWVLPARRRKARAWRMRAASRAKGGSIGVGRLGVSPDGQRAGAGDGDAERQGERCVGGGGHWAVGPVLVYTAGRNGMWERDANVRQITCYGPDRLL